MNWLTDFPFSISLMIDRISTGGDDTYMAFPIGTLVHLIDELAIVIKCLVIVEKSEICSHNSCILMGLTTFSAKIQK